MGILLGTERHMQNGRRGSIAWQPDKSINGHALIVGASGVGKTHRLRILANALVQNYNCKIIIIDVHGDISIPGEDRVSFSESSAYGLNPLKVNPDRHSGGIRRRIRSFISMLNRSSTKLGLRQEATLTRLLEDLYDRNGFKQNDWRTWDPRTNPHARGRSRSQGVYPNISDLRNFAAYKLRVLKTGAGGEAFQALHELEKRARAMYSRALKSVGDSSDQDHDPGLDNLCLKANEAFQNMTARIKTGNEVNDWLRYPNAEILSSTLDRIDHLDKAGIFKDAPPPLSPRSAIHTYDIKSIGRDEQKMFVDILLEELWLEVKARGQRSVPDTFIIIDEASIFLSDEPDHIINTLIRECRKFGLAIIFASQSVNHFSEDVLANVGMKLILGVDQMFVSQLARMLRIDGKLLDNIRPRRTALVQCKVVGDQRNDFTEIFLA